MRIGIIGAGTIGQLLASRFVESGKIRPSEVIVSDTDKAKLGALQSKGIRAAESNRQAVECSDLVFLCIRPTAPFTGPN
ncbi:MAG: NAD(P)-binding domain-containing protein [Candidatus Diapherotrites archaeon]|nr:NAD(P)-binding domain-containing protein [Candidatus Diapherotrites archaeon]